MRQDVSKNNTTKRREQVNGQWLCSRCGQYKDSDCFGKISANWNELDCTCKDCRSHKRKSSEEREWIWEFCMNKRYGISKEDYYQLLDDQNGVCAICFKPELSGRKLSVDHCHKTNKVRGLLCTKCNTALGLLDDSFEYITNALNYIITH